MPAISYTCDTLWRKHTTEVTADGIVRVTERKGGTEHMYQVPLAKLSPHFTTYTDTKKMSLVGGICLAAVAIALVAGSFFEEQAGMAGTLLVAFFPAGLAVIGFLNRLLGGVDVVLFTDREGKRVLLSMPRGKDAAKLDDFLAGLVGQIPKE